MVAFENMYYKFPSDNDLGIPNILPFEGEYMEDTRWIPFINAMKERVPGECGVHFFLNDAQFERVWTTPYKYIPILKKYRYVAVPDFSGYCTMPIAVRYFQKYKRHFIARLWQLHGINVIDVPQWTGVECFDWEFAGEPKNNIIFISSVGTQNSEEHRKFFIDGFKECETRLEPRNILWQGIVPNELQNRKITRINAFQDKFNNHNIDEFM